MWNGITLNPEGGLPTTCNTTDDWKQRHWKLADDLRPARNTADDNAAAWLNAGTATVLLVALFGLGKGALNHVFNRNQK